MEDLFLTLYFLIMASLNRKLTLSRTFGFIQHFYDLLDKIPDKTKIGPYFHDIWAIHYFFGGYPEARVLKLLILRTYSEGWVLNMKRVGRHTPGIKKALKEMKDIDELESPPYHISKIAKYLEMSPKIAWRAVKNLEKHGLVVTRKLGNKRIAELSPELKNFFEEMQTVKDLKKLGDWENF
jgi:DNA-binding MarR family transcriptional regulator